MSDKKDLPEEQQPGQNTYGGSSAKREGSGLFNRFREWLTADQEEETPTEFGEGENTPAYGDAGDLFPPDGEEAAEASPSAPPRGQGAIITLLLPGGVRVSLRAHRVLQPAPGELELALSPPPSNPEHLLEALGWRPPEAPARKDSRRDDDRPSPTNLGHPSVGPEPSGASHRTSQPKPPPKPARSGQRSDQLMPTGPPAPRQDLGLPPPLADETNESMELEDPGAFQDRLEHEFGDAITMAGESGEAGVVLGIDGGQLDAQINMEAGGDALPGLDDLDDDDSPSGDVHIDEQIQASLKAHAPGADLREEDMEVMAAGGTAPTITDDLSVPEDISEPPPPPPGVINEKAPCPIGRASPLVGFDFGTSYSAVGLYDSGFQLAQDEDGEVQMPSVVSFPSADWTLIGNQARERMSSEAQWTIASPKRLLGRPFTDPKVTLQLRGLAFKTFAGSDKFVRFEAHGEIYSVGDICAMILTEMKERAERHFGTRIRRAVFAVPVSYSSIQRSALDLAARQAGLEVVGLLTEPSASVLAHGLRGRKGTVAVYDFGGGTFDFCVLRVRDTAFEVLCAGGEPWLGGDDFDSVLASHIAELFQKQTGIDLRNRAVELQALLFACEAAKRKLSSARSTDMRLGDLVFTAEGKKGLLYKLSRRRFDKLTSHLVEKSLAISEKVLKQAGLSPGDVGTVVMSGGTTLIPLVRERVADFFDLNPLVGEPDLAVVKGAALRAAELDGVSIDATTLAGRTLKEVAGRTIGLGVKGGSRAILIERSMPLPAEASHSVATWEDGQTEMAVKLYEEASSDLEGGKTIGRLRFRGIKPAPAGEGKIDFTVLLDEDGILHIAAMVEGKEHTKTIKLG